MKRVIKKPVAVEKEVIKVVEMGSEIVTDNSKEFEDVLGKEVAIFCVIYIYSGTLVGVNETHVVLENAKIVYETGAFTSPDWKDAQALPAKEVKVRKDMVECHFEVCRGGK